MKTILTCVDFHKAGFLFDCCCSCHSDDLDNIADTYPRTKDETYEDMNSRFWVCDSCCGFTEEKFSRNDWAKTIKYKRRNKDESK